LLSRTASQSGTGCLHLQSLVPDCQVILDSSDTGQVGNAIVVPPHIKLIDSGFKGDGTFAWAKIKVAIGTLHIESVYAPANRSQQIQFWHWLKGFLNDGDWLLAGDHNMVEMPEDSFGTSTIFHGTECHVWHSFVDQHDLLDLYLCSSRRRGPIHTRQAQSGARTDAARLDRFYTNKVVPSLITPPL
jgi:hypothetical protein